MRPSFLDHISWRMAEVYGSVTDRIMINLAKYFPFIKSADQIQSAMKFLTEKLEQMGSVISETIRIIVEGLSGADEALGSVLEETVSETMKTED